MSTLRFVQLEFHQSGDAETTFTLGGAIETKARDAKITRINIEIEKIDAVRFAFAIFGSVPSSISNLANSRFKLN